ncbi:MAG: efflux RND transporter periplasmic adaptor subunit [Anaerolineae bacterium]|nr:efflux RND transporter periplasmic adaptor subunit [Anaerolineae bacterium]
MMNQELPALILGTTLALIGIGIVVWWLSRRITQPGLKRTLLRAVVMVTATALVVGVGLSTVNSQAANQAEAETPVVAESLVVGTGDLSVSLTAAGSLLPADEKAFSFAIEAPVLEVPVEVGDIVAKGDVLARLDTTDLEAQIASAEIALAEAQAAYDHLTAPARDIDIQIAEASVEAAQASLSSADQGPSAADVEIARLEAELAKNQLWQTQINRDVRLAANPEFRGENAYAQEVSTNAGVENQELSVQAAEVEYQGTLEEGPDASSLASANAQLESAQAELDSLLSGPSEAELRKASIDLENAQLNLANAQQTLEQAVLVAPFDGFVASENLTVDSLPPEDEEAITLIDLSQFIVSLSIDETDIVEISLGQTVQLAVQALADAQVTGRITYIDLAPTSSGELVTYTTEVTVDPTDAVLRPGMSTVATIVLEELNEVITVPNRFITTDGTTQQSAVTVQVAPGTYQSVPVTLGLRTLEDSQILSGVNAGQTIVILSSGEDTTEQSGIGLGIPGLGGGAGRTGGGDPGAGGPPSGGFGG